MKRPEMTERARSVVRWESGLLDRVLRDLSCSGSASSSQFLTKGNLFYLCLSIGELAIMTLPLALIIIVGEIDLSVASILGPVERDARLPRRPRLAAVVGLRRRDPARRRGAASSTAC